MNPTDVLSWPIRVLDPKGCAIDAKKKLISLNSVCSLLRLTRPPIFFNILNFFTDLLSLDSYREKRKKKLFKRLFIPSFSIAACSWPQGLDGQLEPIPVVIGWGEGDTINKMSAHHRATLKQTTTSQTWIHTCGQIRVSNYPDMHVFRLWQKDPGENPLRHNTKYL